MDLSNNFQLSKFLIILLPFKYSSDDIFKLYLLSAFSLNRINLFTIIIKIRWIISKNLIIMKVILNQGQVLKKIRCIK